MKIQKDIAYCDMYACQRLDMYLPESEAFSAFIYFHGGGLEAGDKQDGAIVAKYLTDRNTAVISPNYRMYPHAAYPDFIRDAAGAVAWTLRNIGKYGKCEHVYVGGSSAGGYLSQMLCFDKKYLVAYGIDPDELSGYFHDAGQPTVHFNILRERGLDTRRVLSDPAAPIYHVTAGRRYAPMQFVVSDGDIENRYEQTLLMLSTMKHMGCDMSRTDLRYVTHSTHCSYCHLTDEAGDSVLGRMIYEFVCMAEKMNGASTARA